ncbi:MAG: peptidoglycan-binding domain-containing protein [Acidobacteria bacterium]|nr:peptidoglycan-binding domain-containing protein [Acidobacteriota bacterium]
MEPSGPLWVGRFPTSKVASDLAAPFRGNVERFIAALTAAGAHVAIEATLRPPERAYMMHYAYRIAKEGLDPARIPVKPGVSIQWLHRNSANGPDIAASRTAALKMVEAFGIVHRPALQSRHSEGKAIDMIVRWTGGLRVRDANGVEQLITSLPRDGSRNVDLHRVGASYGVLKLVSDPPHWSLDGH